MQRIANLPGCQVEQTRGLRLDPAGLLHGLDEAVTLGQLIAANRRAVLGAGAIRESSTSPAIGEGGAAATGGLWTETIGNCCLNRGDGAASCEPLHSTAERQPSLRQEKSSPAIASPRASVAVRNTQFSSSRILPGKPHSDSTSMAEGDNVDACPDPR